MAGKRRAPSVVAAPSNGGLAMAHGGPSLEDPQGRIAAIQRARLLGAVAEVCAEHGVASLTVGHIVERAGVSRRTFYENFPGREDCLLVAVQDALERLAGRVAPVYGAPGRWLERMRAAVLAALEFFEEEPHTARLLIVETLGSGAPTLRLRRTVLAAVTAAVDEARSETRGGSDLSPLTAEGAVGGALAVLHARLLDRDPAPLVELAGELMRILVLPYLGPSAARRELGRPLPQTTSTRQPSSANPLPRLDMRLTYRTVRVLFAVAANPSASNRELATAAGIHDQGQASKLLTRLQRLGLVENKGAGVRHGAPNAWILTDTGAQVQQAIGSGPSV